MPHLCSVRYAEDELNSDMWQSQGTDGRSGFGSVCVHLDVDALWPAMNGIANAVIQCLTSSKVTSSESRRYVSSALACAMSSPPAPLTMGHLFFSLPRAAYISQNVTHCLQFVFLFALCSCCFEQSLAVWMFFTERISLHLDADPAMLVNAGSVTVYWWGSKTTSMVFMVKLVDIAR